MSVQDSNIAVIRRWLEEGWSQGHLEVADELIDASFSVHGAGGQVVRSGPDGAKQLVAAWRAGFPDGRMTVDDIFAEGDKVVIRMTWNGTHTGSFYGYPPSGQRVSVTSTGIDRLANGKVVEGWGELDMLGLYQQIGVLPRPSAGGPPPNA